jgi:hypothetical protein
MYTILSARWGDEAHASVVIDTVESGSVVISARDTPEAWADYILWAINNPISNPPVRAAVIPMTISDRQFYQQIAVLGLITDAEALAAVKTGDIPATLQGLISALPADDQFAATMLLSGAVEFKRAHPLTVAFGAAMGWTSEQLDNLWVEASKL